MKQPSAETMAQYRAEARRVHCSDGPVVFRRTMRAISAWMHKGQLGGAASETNEITRYTGGRV